MSDASWAQNHKGNNDKDISYARLIATKKFSDRTIVSSYKLEAKSHLYICHCEAIDIEILP